LESLCLRLSKLWRRLSKLNFVAAGSVLREEYGQSMAAGTQNPAMSGGGLAVMSYEWDVKRDV
jgi:hypothetical protein